MMNEHEQTPGFPQCLFLNAHKKVSPGLNISEQFMTTSQKITTAFLYDKALICQLVNNCT